MNTPEPSSRVEVRREVVVLPTYEPEAPDRNPMFLEKRVYQGSSGRVYPLPFTDRIAETPRPRSWDAVYIENEFICIMILPELGGRIHRAQDKTNGFDFIYYQPVIKPALVGLAGPWASGGIEFNWPQHHRPSTFMPADVAIEEHADGAKTVWLSEHDPMARMKGMHGVRLHPGKSYMEVVARAYNRTSDVQTFLWWANVAVRAHESYQSFFPPDAAFVADHAKRAISTFPLCEGTYYGVDYASRQKNGIPADETPGNYLPPRLRPATGDRTPAYGASDLSWYANIPVPTSYMCLGSQENFSGGYDHRAKAGIVHIADHHISPGKKQWTWGNHEFGYAWDRNLTDPDENGEYRPYMELMGGVFTDNQPDFSFLQPGESRTWSQYWYPIRAIGTAQKANLEVALSFGVARGIAHIGVTSTARYRDAKIQLLRRGKVVGEWTQTIAPGTPIVFEAIVDGATPVDGFTLRLESSDGVELASYTPASPSTPSPPAPATEPPVPAEVGSADELFLIGLHLEQYRHATRMPQDYWREALRRDPSDSRCNMALGRWHLRRGEYADSERHLRASISRLLARNPNPYDGEAHYQLGICLRRQAFAASLQGSLLDQAYDSFSKATWNQAWQSAGFHALAEIDALRRNWPSAAENARRALRANADNLRARNLHVIALRKLGRGPEASKVLEETMALDPLDWWSRHLDGSPLSCDNQVRMDLALDYAAIGEFRAALEILKPAKGRRGRGPGAKSSGSGLPDASLGTEPLLHYYRGWLCHLKGDARSERRHFAAGKRASADYCFPARLEEIAILQRAIGVDPSDARAQFYLGNLLYDRRRHPEAIRCWEAAVRSEPSNAVAWRNLGIGYFNICARPSAARAAYERALKADPADGRLLYESDQLLKRIGVRPKARLRRLERHLGLVRRRDDLSVEICALYNQTGAPKRALEIVAKRRFQPWEGGEGLALGQHVRTHIALGRSALDKGNAAAAVPHFEAALSAPWNLGEANHLLANRSDIHYWLGVALAKVGERERGRAHWQKAAHFMGDFQAMCRTAFSEKTFYSAKALSRLGDKAGARRMLVELSKHAQKLAVAPFKLDYFATSLPTMLLFDDDLQERQRTTALFLLAQASLGLGRVSQGRRLLREVLRRDPSHPLAGDQPC
jgi:tetratricopeptide (TPR) repeat protein